MGLDWDRLIVLTRRAGQRVARALRPLDPDWDRLTVLTRRAGQRVEQTGRQFAQVALPQPAAVKA